MNAPADRSRRVLWVLYVAYVAFYLCRSNVEPALTLLANQYGYDNERTGSIMAVTYGAYAVGKLALGPLSDLWGGKRLLVALLSATAVASLVIAAVNAPERFGPSAGFVVIGVLVVANHFVQAGGWSGLVHVVGVTFAESRRGTIMGVLATSYCVGPVVTLLLCAGLTEAGFGWRTLFVVNPLVVAAVACFVHFALPPTPVAPPRTSTDGSPALREIVPRLVRHSSFWFAFALSFLLTFVRAAFMSWTVRFLYEVSVAAHVASPVSSSIAKSAFFGLFGGIGSIVTGRLSDRFGPGRRSVVMTVSLGLLFVCTLALGHAGVTSPLLATAGVAACGLFLLGPYSLLSGAISLDVGGPRGAATAASVIDAVGYVGASLAAFALGSISKRAGWTAAFDVVAAATLIAVVLAGIWTTRKNSAPREGPDSAAPV